QERALDLLLEEGESVGMARGQVAQVERDRRQRAELHRLALRQEAIREAALVEELDRPRVKSAGACAGDALIGATLHDGDRDAGQRELTCKHESGRAAARDHHRHLDSYGTTLIRAWAAEAFVRTSSRMDTIWFAAFEP